VSISDLEATLSCNVARTECARTGAATPSGEKRVACHRSSRSLRGGSRTALSKPLTGKGVSIDALHLPLEARLLRVVA
jgi:hypothetical protein